MERPAAHRPTKRLLISLSATAACLMVPLVAIAQTAQTDADVELIKAGASAYEANCAGCHLADGSGLPGTIPPLKDNPRSEDAAYVAEVIVNGLAGEIEVAGIEYDGQMPAFPSLDEDSVASIVAFVVAGLEVPEPSTQSTVASAPPGTASPATDDELSIGASLYSTQCASCHQAGGVGLSGTFPPLVDNPRVADTDYMIETIRNGRQGEIEVAGVVYNGVMPAFPGIGESDLDALVAYIQSGFQAPSAPVESSGTALPVATGALPELSSLAILAAFALAFAAGVFVLWPRLTTAVDRLEMPWLDATLRSVVIVLFFIVGTAVIPSAVLKSGTVGRLDRIVQDLIGSGLWFGALLAGLAALWWAHRENRI